MTSIRLWKASICTMIGEAPSWKPICQGLGLSAKAPGGAATTVPTEAIAKKNRFANHMLVISPVLWKARGRERHLAGARPADPWEPLFAFGTSTRRAGNL